MLKQWHVTKDQVNVIHNCLPPVLAYWLIQLSLTIRSNTNSISRGKSKQLSTMCSKQEFHTSSFGASKIVRVFSHWKSSSICFTAKLDTSFLQKKIIAKNHDNCPPCQEEWMNKGQKSNFTTSEKATCVAASRIALNKYELECAQNEIPPFGAC